MNSNVSSPAWARAARTLLPLAVVAGTISPAAAQEVIVFAGFPPIPGTADNTQGLRRGVNQGILVIPVISQDTPFDPDNNLLNTWDPALPGDLVAKFAEVNDLWLENSYGEVSFTVEVLDRYYQMPRETDYYFNPAYVTPTLTGTAIQGPNVTVPTGQVRLFLHVTDADETTIDLPFDVADSPYTFAGLQTAIEGVITTLVGDKIALTLGGCGVDCRRLEFEVAQTYVRAGTYLHIDFSASDDAVLDALGLDRPGVDLGVPNVTGAGAELPYTTIAADAMTLQVENGVDPPQTYTWTMGADALNTVNDFIALHGATHPEVAMTAVGNELRLTVAPPIAGPYTSVSVSGAAALLDRLGLDASVEVDGTINLSAQNTIKGDRRHIAGQAISAFVLNELTRDPAAPGPDPFPNLAITPANDAAIHTMVETAVDPRRLVAVIFIDAPNKRAGASGGTIPVGLRNGAYDFVHITRASIQIQYDFSSAATIAHETGHNIGFADLYNNSNGEYDPALRYPVDWDIMHAQGNKPHTGVWHKEVDNGWLTASGANVEVMPEPGTTGVVQTEHYVLTPLELPASGYDDLLAAVPGRTIAKAIRLPIGLGVAANDHFLLVQNRQRGPAFSQNLPQHPAAADRGGVYITDAISRASFDFFKPTTRNFVHPVNSAPPVGLNVRPILDEDPAADIDFLGSYPAYDGLDVDIVGEVNGPAPFADRPAYLVDVTREQKDFLELGLAPWGAPPWESVDIWIEHGNKAVLSTVPLAGNGEPARWAVGYNPAANGGNPLNWIRAKITNSGTVGATAVQIRVRVNQPGGMGDSGTWVILGTSDPIDIAAGDSEILQVGWNPSVNSHTCVEVEVYRWTSTLGDRDPWNNRTQENVTLFQPTANSPWGTTPFSFEIANGRSFPMDVQVEVEDLPRGYILTIDQPLVRVDAESAVMVHGTLELDDAIIPPPVGLGGTQDPDSPRDPYKPRVDVFHLTGHIVGDEYQIPAGGITMVSIPSVGVDLDVDVRVAGNGNITVSGSTTPVAPGTEVEIELRYPSGRFEWVTVTTDGAGRFDTTIPPEEDGNVRVTVRIPPGQGAAPTDGGVDMVNTREPTRPGGARSGHRIDMFFGGVVTDDSLALDGGLEWGVRYGFHLATGWTLEAELGIGETDTPLNDGLLVRGQVNLLRELGGTWMRPFVLVGLGVAHLDGIGRSDTEPLFTAGVGADAQWTSQLGLRLDVRYLRMQGLYGGPSSNNWQLQWGPTFRF